jgi:hypothetical protein
VQGFSSATSSPEANDTHFGSPEPPSSRIPQHYANGEGIVLEPKSTSEPSMHVHFATVGNGRTSKEGDREDGGDQKRKSGTVR